MHQAPATTAKADSATHESEGKGKWLALTAALLGWMFDGAEMGVFTLVGRPAVKELMPEASEGVVGLWLTVIVAFFLVGAATGGVLFGWLGDRIGRVRAMTISVLVYAVFTGTCGLAAEAWQIGVLRFIAALGMGGEWSLGVALVMEIWPNKSRAFMAGLIGAAANVGYMAVGIIGMGMLEVISHLESALRTIHLPGTWVDMLVANSGWRMMMIMGTLPALLTFLIRIFVPESEKWEHENQKGTTSNWASRDLLVLLVSVAGPVMIVYVWAFEQTGSFAHTWPLRVIATLLGLAVAIVGYTYPVVQYFRRQEAANPALEKTLRATLARMMLGACLSGVALLGTWGSTQQAPAWVDKTTEAKWQADKEELIKAGRAAEAAELQRPRAKEYTLMWLSIGAIVGTILAAFAGDWFGRRLSYFGLCLSSLLSACYLFLGTNGYGAEFLFWTFIAGATTASFYGWLPLYLPELFRTSVRATGQGFSFNFGRILAAIGVLQVGNLLKLFDKDVIIAGFIIPHGFPLACSVICLVYVVGMVIIWFAPETRGKPLPE